jgi:hypothetical protein
LWPVAAGIVYEDAQTLERLDLRQYLVSRNVNGPGFDPARFVGSNFSQVIHRAGNGNDTSAGVGERFGATTTDATSPTCYNRDLPVKWPIHLVLRIACECNIA